MIATDCCAARATRLSTPIAESRLRYESKRAEVELVSDRNNGPYASIHRFTALEFLARWVDHVPGAACGGGGVVWCSSLRPRRLLRLCPRLTG